MREQPEGLRLLQIAATALREQLLPGLAEEHRYVVLMALNAISIAGRQLRSDERTIDYRRQLLEGVLAPRTGPGPGPRFDPRSIEAPQEQLARLEREFALRVRFGAADHDLTSQQALWRLTVERVRESAPRYLETEAIE